MQSPSPPQLVGQPLPLPSQRYGAQPGLPLEPWLTTVHVPSLPLRLHASQGSAQLVSQQTSSTQLSLWHWLSPSQLVPLVLSAWHWSSPQ